VIVCEKWCDVFSLLSDRISVNRSVTPIREITQIYQSVSWVSVDWRTGRTIAALELLISLGQCIMRRSGVGR
jgi:hypothetical protein